MQTQNGVLFKSSQVIKDLTRETLLESLSDPVKKRQLLDQISAYPANIRGSKAYWSNTDSLLKSLCEILEPRHCFSL